MAGKGNSFYCLTENKVTGVQTAFGTRFNANAVILTNGTFLNGLMHIGFNNIKGGEEVIRLQQV